MEEHGASTIIKSYFLNLFDLIKSKLNIFALNFNLFKLDLSIFILLLLISFNSILKFLFNIWKDFPPGAEHASKKVSGT